MNVVRNELAQFDASFSSTIVSLAQKFLFELLVVNRRKVSDFFSFFCIQFRRCVVPRKGWSSLPTPARWHQVIRGGSSSSWWRQHGGQWPIAKPEKAQVQWRWQRGQASRATNPDEVLAAVQRLERAIEVLGDNDSAERQWLTSALEQARRAAQDRPAAQQVEECQAFIQRSRNRLLRGAQRSCGAVDKSPELLQDPRNPLQRQFSQIPH